MIYKIVFFLDGREYAFFSHEIAYVMERLANENNKTSVSPVEKIKNDLDNIFVLMNRVSGAVGLSGFSFELSPRKPKKTKKDTIYIWNENNQKIGFSCHIYGQHAFEGAVQVTSIIETINDLSEEIKEEIAIILSKEILNISSNYRKKLRELKSTLDKKPAYENKIEDFENAWENYASFILREYAKYYKFPNLELYFKTMDDISSDTFDDDEIPAMSNPPRTPLDLADIDLCNFFPINMTSSLTMLKDWINLNTHIRGDKYFGEGWWLNLGARLIWIDKSDRYAIDYGLVIDFENIISHFFRSILERGFNNAEVENIYQCYVIYKVRTDIHEKIKYFFIDNLKQIDTADSAALQNLLISSITTVSREQAFSTDFSKADIGDSKLDLFDLTLKRFMFLADLVTPYYQGRFSLSKSKAKMYDEIQKIMHFCDARKYILYDLITDFKKKTAFNNTVKPYRPENAYGKLDGEDYRGFARTITELFNTHQNLNDNILAKNIRRLLAGKSLDSSQQLHFLPSLVGAWFVSEVIRHPSSFYTGLMLLDLIESNIQYHAFNSDHYTFRNGLVHPLKSLGYSYIYVLNENEPPIKQDELILVVKHAGEQLTVYWWDHKNVMRQASREKSESEIEAILTCLPTPGIVSSNRSLIGKIMAIFKVGQQVKIKDIYGDVIENINLFDGYHPMVQAKATEQLQSLTDESALTPVRQKEAHLTLHWLSEKIKRKNPDLVHFLGYSDDVFADDYCDFPTHERSCFLDKSNLSYQEIKKLYENRNQSKKTSRLKILHEIIIPLLKERFVSLDNALSAALLPTQNKREIGARAINRWKLQDVEDEGNCFYLAVIEQMKIINHHFLATIPVGTLPNDSLRLRVQKENFLDKEWADIAEILQTVKQLNIVIAIVDTRHSNLGFRCYYPIPPNEAVETYDPAQIPENIPIIRLAYTGNHYLSVQAHPELTVGAIRRGFTDPRLFLLSSSMNTNFWAKQMRRLHEEELRNKSGYTPSTL